MNDRYESPLEELRRKKKTGIGASCFRGTLLVGYVAGWVWVVLWAAQ